MGIYMSISVKASTPKELLGHHADDGGLFPIDPDLFANHARDCRQISSASRSIQEPRPVAWPG